MKIEITQWLQEAIYEHAQKMACAKVIAEHGGEEIGWYASDQCSSFGYGNDYPNPQDGLFNFDVAKGIGSKRKSHYVTLDLRDVVRDYIREDST